MKREVVLLSILSCFFLVLIGFVYAAGEIVKAPEAGEDVCAFHCNEYLQRCAPNCPCYYPRADGTCMTPEESAEDVQNKNKESGFDQSLVDYSAYSAAEEAINAKYTEILKELGQKYTIDCPHQRCNQDNLVANGCTGGGEGSYGFEAQPPQCVSLDAAWGPCYQTCQNEYIAENTKVNNERQAELDALDKQREAALQAQSQQQQQQYQQQAQQSQKSNQQSSQNQQSDQQTEQDPVVQRYNYLKDYVSPATVKSITDKDGLSISDSYLKNGLGENLPAINVDVKVPDLKSGYVFGVTLPKGGYLGEGIFYLNKDVQGQEMTISQYDGPTTVKLLRGPNQEIDTKTGGIPKDVPGDVSEYFEIRLKNSVPGEISAQQDMFKEALFKWHMNMQYKGEYTLESYNEQKKAWEKKETSCSAVNGTDYNYECVSDPEGTGYYAIVKAPRLGATYGTIMIFLLMIETAIIFGLNWFLKKRDKKSKSKGKGIASLVLGILGILLAAAYYLGFILAGLAIVLSRSQKRTNPTGLATAGFVLGIIGMALSSLIAIFGVIAFFTIF